MCVLVGVMTLTPLKLSADSSVRFVSYTQHIHKCPMLQASQTFCEYVSSIEVHWDIFKPDVLCLDAISNEVVFDVYMLGA